MELSNEARCVMDEARKAYGPSAADRRRVQLRLSQKLAAIGVASIGTKASATVFGVWGGKAGIAGLVLGFAGIAAVSFWVWPHHVGTEKNAVVATARRAIADDTDRSFGHRLATPTSSPNPVATATEIADRDQTQPPGASARTDQSTASRAVKAVPPEPDVQGEIALLGKAQQALSSGQYARAIQLLGEHARRYPRGALAEERYAARVIALCKLGQVTQARREAEQFFRRSPDSPLRGRVHAACAGSLEADASNKTFMPSPTSEMAGH
jgi:hypothetical protein